MSLGEKPHPTHDRVLAILADGRGYQPAQLADATGIDRRRIHDVLASMRLAKRIVRTRIAANLSLYSLEPLPDIIAHGAGNHPPSVTKAPTRIDVRRIAYASSVWAWAQRHLG